MTVQVAPRAVIDLGAHASVLEAMDRVRAASGADEIVLSVAAGAPVLRSPVFLEVLRRASGSRRIAIVTPDARARSLAAAVHVPAFASVVALERMELDATEHLGPVRRAAIAAAQPKPPSRLRAIAIATSLVAALLILLAVVAPSATVVVAPVSQALGPLEYDLRAGPNNADIGALTLRQDITARFNGTATGSRREEVKATGVVRFTNQTTNAIRIPQGTVVSTRDNIRFQTLMEKTLPASSFTIFPPSVNAGTVDVPVEALDAGTKGNVAAHAITVSPQSGFFGVDNPQPTTGGDQRIIPIVQRADYDAAASRADTELRKQADAQLATWRKDAAKGRVVYGVFVKTSSLSGPEIVGKELKPNETTFEMVATGTAFAYSVADTEPSASAKARLGQAAETGFEMDPEGVVVDPVGTFTVLEDGVHWRVRVRGTQSRRLDEAQIRSSVTGRAFNEIEGVIADRGLVLRRVTIWPGLWWPRMPVLDSRIKVQKDAPAPP